MNANLRALARRAPALATLWTLTIVASHHRVAAQSDHALSGSWRGDLVTPVGPLTLVLTLDGGATGAISAPDRGVSGIPVADVTLGEDGAVTFGVPADAASFEGRLAAEDRLVGEWIQAGQRIEITFERVGDVDAEVVVRPRRQTPRPPFPYEVEEVAVAAGVRLACTLTRPARGGPDDRPTPGAVLLTVAGPNDRDQTHSGHKPYLVLADHLTRSGVAVLRCDDRGVGGSGGSLLDSTMDDLVADALALVRYLAGRDDVGPVGVIGNSEGSVVGSIAAARAPDEVAFAVLLGGVGVRGAEVIRERLLAQVRATGEPEDVAQARLAPFDSLIVVVTTAGGVGATRLAESNPELYTRLVAIARDAGANDPFLPADLDERVALLAGPWYHAQLTLDGGAVLERVRVPVLALTGSKDRVNLPDQNLPAIRVALERAGNPDFEVSEVEGLNHLFQTAEEGGLAEYGRLEESFSPAALEIITRWILARFGPAG
ncbi:MAG: alpha/beta hydrolase [Gemmatimonadota bacterium]|nr:alpha/beta hydrolase [Gemmatimonadota bacterium]